MLFSLPWSLNSSIVYICEGWIILSIALGLKGHIPYGPKSKLDFFFVNECSRAWFTSHQTNVILYSSIWLFLNMVTSKCYFEWFETRYIWWLEKCDVWDGRVIMFKPISCACDFVSKVTWLPCPFRINNCLLLKEIPLKTNFLKKEKNSLNKKEVIHAFFCIAMQIPSLQSLM